MTDYIIHAFYVDLYRSYVIIIRKSNIYYVLYCYVYFLLPLMYIYYVVVKISVFKKFTDLHELSVW